MFQITGIGATEMRRKRQVDFVARNFRLLLEFQAVTSFWHKRTERPDPRSSAAITKTRLRSDRHVILPPYTREVVSANASPHSPQNLSVICRSAPQTQHRGEASASTNERPQLEQNIDPGSSAC